jgi:hypothetical protein
VLAVDRRRAHRRDLLDRHFPARLAVLGGADDAVGACG